MHQMPFFYVHILWLFVFYLGGMYDFNSFSSYKKIFERILKSMAAATVLAALVFYSMPGIEIAPKTNLFIDIAMLSPLLILWRKIFWDLISKTSKIKVLFFGTSPETKNLADTLKSNPQLGYKSYTILDSANHDLPALIKQNQIQLIVASKNALRRKETAKYFYKMLPLGISMMSFEDFYESITEKIPVSIINEDWFLENLAEINSARQ